VAHHLTVSGLIRPGIQIGGWGFLHRQHPRIDEAIMEVLALEAKRPGPGPRLQDKVVGLVEILAVVSRVGVVGELFTARAAHPSGDQPATGDHIDHREFFGQAQRIRHDRRGITKQHDLDPSRRPRQNRRFNVHHRAHAKWCPMMLVEHHAVEAEFVAVDLLVQILVQQLRALLRVEKGVGQTKKTAAFQYFFFRHVMVRALGEPHDMHRYFAPTQ
jgi:hypothetical protein